MCFGIGCVYETYHGDCNLPWGKPCPYADDLYDHDDEPDDEEEENEDEEDDED